MKTILLIFGLLASSSILMAQGNIRDAQISKCKKEFRDKMKGTNVSDMDIQSFCECNADKLLAKFTADEIQKMDAIMASGTDQQKQIVAEKITPIIMPCFADLQAKLND